MLKLIIIDEIGHGLFVIPFALFLWQKTRSYKKVLLLFLISYLIDLDHLVDYFAFYGFHFDLIKFLYQKYFVITQRGYVPLHAWEWIILVGVLVKLKGWKSCYAVILLGLLPHIVYDSIVVGSFISYSIVMRGLNGFSFYN